MSTLSERILSPARHNTFALLIAGSRDYTDYAEFSDITDYLLSQVRDKYEILILEGEARGTDTLARLYAEEHGYRLDKYPADWNTYGKSAGLWRNEVMVSQLQLYQHRAALYFWNGRSRGTAHCIGEAKKLGIPIKVWNYETRQFMKDY